MDGWRGERGDYQYSKNAYHSGEVEEVSKMAYNLPFVNRVPTVHMKEVEKEIWKIL